MGLSSVCVCVCVCVCESVKSHLTSGASVRPENTVTYPAGNRGQKNGVFFETAPFRSYGVKHKRKSQSHTVQYRDCYGLSPLKTIYKVFHHFHFQFATYRTSVNMNV